ncbi:MULTISPECIES: complex I 24 kDa subunit family protein [Anoxynatronum]|uniref:NADH-quinone oxidoreductase subunit E n=2 Tax=Anoxynatronum TaxID=210622 RepID=A0AA45WU41_9CLOT|nr:NAD(P)H-dependent oxidoreductase subunit E [Anoxynatronum buryatiense]SMP45397.1 NADH-quinone oxidoreductase subunit E [Anoxynatronum buryatiense]
MAKEFLTEENFQKLDEVILRHKNRQGALMPVLQEAQDIFGCLPIEVQRQISEGIKIPMSEIYGVVTFYSQFTLEPKGEYTISICMGTACYVRGAKPMVEKVAEMLGIAPGETSADAKFSLVATRCIGACGLAPILTVNEDVYGRLTLEDIPGIVEKYQKEGS